VLGANRLATLDVSSTCTGAPKIDAEDDIVGDVSKHASDGFRQSSMQQEVSTTIGHADAHRAHCPSPRPSRLGRGAPLVFVEIGGATSAQLGGTRH